MIWEFAQLSFFGASDHQISHIYDDNLSLVEASIFWPQMGHCAGFLNLVDIGMVSTMKTMFSRPIYGCVSKSCIPLEMAILWKTKQVCLKVGCTTNYVYQWVGQMLMNHDDPVDFGIFLRFPMAHRLSVRQTQSENLRKWSEHLRIWRA